jgi:hypothetical protein
LAFGDIESNQVFDHEYALLYRYVLLFHIPSIRIVLTTSYPAGNKNTCPNSLYTSIINIIIKTNISIFIIVEDGLAYVILLNIPGNTTTTKLAPSEFS